MRGWTRPLRLRGIRERQNRIGRIPAWRSPPAILPSSMLPESLYRKWCKGPRRRRGTVSRNRTNAQFRRGRRSEQDSGWNGSCGPASLREVRMQADGKALCGSGGATAASRTTKEEASAAPMLPTGTKRRAAIRRRDWPERASACISASSR